MRDHSEERSFREEENRPWLTQGLVVANVLIFLGQLAADRYSRFPVAEWFALSLAGMKAGHLWQLLTYQFLHGGWLHLLLNCWALYVFGRELELNLGRARFLKLYLFSGILGGVVQLLCSIFSPRLFGGAVEGASAGVFGLVAAFAALFPRRQLTLLIFFVIPATIRARTLFIAAVVVAVLGAVFTVDNVAHAAHLGGMLGGLLYLNWMRSSLRRSEARVTRGGASERLAKPAVEHRRSRA
ncbi:MAG TPA: rhomboid family intramembrane serine protease [Verrucomicrobiota bacterium]|nr:rhomboid family intramembrane serine protease [Verrucomicrobiales bacterium]HRI12285.1 rhomboid family intramembrane serine protease [Verrucomicrobiota bacterium]